MAVETPQLDGSADSLGSELSAAVASIAGRCFPLEVGDFRVDERGRIRPRDSAVPLRLAFAYRGVEYHAEVETASEPQVRLTAELGKLPYSMEIGEGRRLIRRILDESARASHGRINLSKDDDLRLEAVSTPPEPFTPASLMATLTALLFDFQPYLDLLGRVLDDARRTTTAGRAG
ncbi:MAG: hypothetical protein ACTSQ7_03600 [Alphaproteobacteria bacterium]